MPAKQALSAVLALLLAVSFAAPSGARALSDAGFEYTVSAGAATVTGCTGPCSATIVIPGTLGGDPVTSIGDFAFNDNLLESVTIPDSVTSIGDFAFNNNLLESVTIPDSVTSIGDAAFEFNDLKSVTIGNSVTSIGEAAFYGNLLTSVTIPNSVESIGNTAFYFNNLTSVTIGNSVTRIGDSAFFACPGMGGVANALTSVTIPDSVTSIGDYAFFGNLLIVVTFLGNAPTAGDGVFNNNSGLAAVTRPSTATGWGDTWSGVPVTTVPVGGGDDPSISVIGSTRLVGSTTEFANDRVRWAWLRCTRDGDAGTSSRLPLGCRIAARGAGLGSSLERRAYRLSAADRRSRYMRVAIYADGEWHYSSALSVQ